MRGIDFREIADAFNARRKELRVTKRLEHRFPRCSNRNFTFNVQGKYLVVAEIEATDCLTSKASDFVSAVDIEFYVAAIASCRNECLACGHALL